LLTVADEDPIEWRSHWSTVSRVHVSVGWYSLADSVKYVLFMTQCCLPIDLFLLVLS